MHPSTTSSNSPSPISPIARTLALGACAMTLLLALRLCIRARNDFRFEDAYMFFRYAVQLRHGFGISWNPGGPHTFGLTSLSWLVVVWLGSFISFIPQHLLPSLSSAIGMLALFLLSWLFSRRAHSPWLRHVSITFPLVTFPLLFNHPFDISLTNGMETMLGLLLVTLFLFQLLRLIDQPSPRQCLLLALLAILAVLTRPEALLPIAPTPVCAIPLLPRDRRLPLLSLFFAVLGFLLAANLLFNRAYFGTPVPLAFYIKAVHGYADFVWLLNPFAANLTFFDIAAPALLAIVLFSHRHQLRLLLLFFVPLAVLLLYMLSVMQIMGTGARYYVPFLPFLLLPALLLTDQALTPASPSPATSAPFAPVSFARLVYAVVLLFFTNPSTPITSSARSERCSLDVIRSGIHPSSASPPVSPCRVQSIPGPATVPSPTSPQNFHPAAVSPSPRSASSAPPHPRSICSTWPVSTTTTSPITTSTWTTFSTSTRTSSGSRTPITLAATASSAPTLASFVTTPSTLMPSSSASPCANRAPSTIRSSPPSHRSSPTSIPASI